MVSAPGTGRCPSSVVLLLHPGRPTACICERFCSSAVIGREVPLLQHNTIRHPHGSSASASPPTRAGRSRLESAAGQERDDTGTGPHEKRWIQRSTRLALWGY